MPPEERDPASLWDMLDAARAVARFASGLSLAQFVADDSEMVRVAVERKLEILGEAARRVSAAFREAHSEIPWPELVGLRNVISHEYDKVNYSEVYRIVTQRIPRLIELLAALAPRAPDHGEAQD
jgi:uncharacterized protein with HEPN domain